MKFGGSEQQIINLVEASNRRGLSGYIFCYEGSDLANRADQIKGKVIAVKKQKPFAPGILHALKAAVKQHQIDVIHIHNGKFILPYMLAGIFLGLKSPAIFSKKDMSRSSSLLSKLKYNYSKIYRTACVTESIKKRFQHILYPKNHHKLVVLRHGVNMKKLQDLVPEDIYSGLNIPKETIIIGNVANHVRAKGLRTLVLTLDYLVNTKGIHNIRVVQIGRFSDLTEDLKSLTAEKNLQEYLIFTGFLQYGFKYTSQFDYFIMTSQSEGMPQAALESFFYKIPVVSTNAGGIPEIIKHEINGMLADVDDYEGLGNNIIRLMEDQPLKNRIVANAYELIINELNSEVMTDKTIGLYKDALANSQ